MNRTFFTLPAAALMSAVILFAAAGPAVAATSETCTATSVELRQAAVTAADARIAKRALGYVTTGEKLC